MCVMGYVNIQINANYVPSNNNLKYLFIFKDDISFYKLPRSYNKYY